MLLGAGLVSFSDSAVVQAEALLIGVPGTLTLGSFWLIRWSERLARTVDVSFGFVCLG